MNQKSPNQLTRRAFLGKASAGVALVGAATAVPSLASSSVGHTITTTDDPTSNEPVVAYVRDVQAGEISLLVGTREVIYRDHQLVAQLSRAAATARKVK